MTDADEHSSDLLCLPSQGGISLGLFLKQVQKKITQKQLQLL